MTPEQQAQLITLAISFLIQAAPLVEAYALHVLQYLLELATPDTTQQILLRSAHNIITEIWEAHPDWPDEQKRRYALDAIKLRAWELRVTILPDQLTTWGLA